MNNVRICKTVQVRLGHAHSCLGGGQESSPGLCATTESVCASVWLWLVVLRSGSSGVLVLRSWEEDASQPAEMGHSLPAFEHRDLSQPCPTLPPLRWQPQRRAWAIGSKGARFGIAPFLAANCRRRPFSGAVAVLALGRGAPEASAQTQNGEGRASAHAPHSPLWHTLHTGLGGVSIQSMLGASVHCSVRLVSCCLGCCCCWGRAACNHRLDSLPSMP